MAASINSIAIICLILLCGYIFGAITTPIIKRILIASISKVVYLLLFLMGIDIGWIFVDGVIEIEILLDAFIFATIISIFVFGFLIIKKNNTNPRGGQGSFLAPLFGCLKVVLAFVVGVAGYEYLNAESILEVVSVNHALYFLIFLVGVDLVSFNLKQLNRRHLKVPISTIVGTAIACLAYSTISERTINELLLSSSGHGWFTLSGPMITSLKGPQLGMFAFLTDIFREVISIIFLYLLGSRYPHSAIGISGAAALDSALPFIKENCHKEDVDYAIASGFILTLLAPIFITTLAAVVN